MIRFARSCASLAAACALVLSIAAASFASEPPASLAEIIVSVKADEQGAWKRFADYAKLGGFPDAYVAAEDAERETLDLLATAYKAAAAAEEYSEKALGNADYTGEFYDDILSGLDGLESTHPVLLAALKEAVETSRERGGALRSMRDEVLEQFQDELRRGSAKPGTRLAWSMMRLGVGMAEARIRLEDFAYDADSARLSFTHHDVLVELEMDASDLGQKVRASVNGYFFTAGWAVLLQKPVWWMIAMADSLREAGIAPGDYARWHILEAPEGLIGLASGVGPDGSLLVPDKAFFWGRLRDIETLPVAGDTDATKRFLDAARALHDGVMGDESISRRLRQALRPVLEGTYLPVDPRDYFDNEFCRRLIEADYLEVHIKPMPPERARELAAYREALAHLEAGNDRFAVPLDERSARLVAVARADVSSARAGNDQTSSDELESAPYEWRLEEKDSTSFHSPLPERYLYALSLLEKYEGRHRVRPAGVPVVTEVWHAVMGRIGSYRDGAASAEGNADDWLAAVIMDCRGRLDTTSGPLGWNFPFHVLQRDGQGDPVRLATLGGVVESPDFSGQPDEALRRGAEDAWLDHAAATLRTPGELGLIFHHFFRYCSDSPLPELPNLIGSHYGLSDTHQTVYQSLERRWVGRLIGDCDDLAEFFQVLTSRQGRLSHVMQVPAHAACGYAEKLEDGSYEFVVLQTGPVLRFTGDTLYAALEAAYKSFDSERGSSYITPAAVPILLRFANEDTRTPFVLSARIFEDREYAETMIRVQGYWHLNTFFAAIDTMEEMIRDDRDPGNLKELASLYEQVGDYEPSAELREEELEAVYDDVPSSLSTLLDIAQLRFKEKNKPAAMRALTDMEEIFLRIREEDPELYDGTQPFRAHWAVVAAKLDEPALAWKMLSHDAEAALTRSGRISDQLRSVLVVVYEKIALLISRAGPGGPGEDLLAAREAVESVLDVSFGSGYIRPDDTFNRIQGRYYLLGRYAIALEGRAEGLRLLAWDGPYPEGSRRHHARRRALTATDWEWFRITPRLYLTAAEEMLDPDDEPDLYDPAAARPLLEAVERAVDKGEALGAEVTEDELRIRSSLLLAFLNRDLEAFSRIMAVVRERDYASLYGDAAYVFGEHCGLVPAAEFSGWIEAFRKFFPGQQQYFKAVYRALDQEYFDQALMLAKATAGFFPDEELLVREAARLEEWIPVLRQRAEERKAGETNDGRGEDAAAIGDGASDVSFVPVLLGLAG